MIDTNALVIRYDITCATWEGKRDTYSYDNWEAAQWCWSQVTNNPLFATASLWRVNPHHQRKRVYRMTRAIP